MQLTTEDFDAAIVANPRSFKAKAFITWTDSVIDPEIDITPSPVGAYGSVTEHLANGKIDTPFKYAILDSSASLNSTFHPAPGTTIGQNTYEVGFYGNEIPPVTNVFVTPQVINMVFEERSIFNIYIVGEQTLNQYPVNFTVQLYNNSELKLSVSETDNDKVEYSYPLDLNPGTTIDQMVLIIYKWSEQSSVKITEFYSSVSSSYEGNVITGIDILEESQIHDFGIPIGIIAAKEMRLKLQNVNIDGYVDPFAYKNTNSPYYTYIKPNRRIAVQVGIELSDESYEYLKLGTFFSKEFSGDNQDDTITAICQDRLMLLQNNRFRSEVYESVNLYELANIILESAKSNVMADLAWDLDSYLHYFELPYAYFGDVTYFEALRQICEASTGFCYVDRDDTIRITLPQHTLYSGTPDLTITKSMYFTKRQPQKNINIANYVKVQQKNPIPKSSPEAVYEEAGISIGALETTGEIIVKFTSFPVMGCSIAISDESGCTVSVSSEDYYAWGASFVFTETSGSSGTFAITVTGTVLEIESKDFYSENATSKSLFGKKEYALPRNNLVQSEAHALTLCSEILDLFSDDRRDMQIEWCGNPAVELNDIFNAPEYQRNGVDNTADFQIYKNQIKFDGGFEMISTGRIREADFGFMSMQDSDNGIREIYEIDTAATKWQDRD